MASRRPISPTTPEPDPFSPDPEGALGAAAVDPAVDPQQSFTKTAPGAVSEVAAAPPQQRTKLALALDKMNADVSVIQGYLPTIAELEAKYPKGHQFPLGTKADVKAADAVRKQARTLRLDVTRMRKQGTDTLNDLKAQLWAVTDPTAERLQAIEDSVKDQLDAKEQAEKDRVKRHEDNIASIEALAHNLTGVSAEVIAERMSTLEAVIVDDSYEEFRDLAIKAAAEAHDTLSAAFAAAMERETLLKEEAQRRAQLESELADAKDKQSRAERIKARIQTIRDLPGQVEGTSAENIRVAIRAHGQAVPDAEHYGDWLDMAAMAHELTGMKLDALYAAAVKAELAETPLPGATAAHDLLQQHAQDDGAEVLAPQASDEPAADLFAEAPAPAVPRPRGGGVWRTPAPTPAPAPTPEPDMEPTDKVSRGDDFYREALKHNKEGMKANDYTAIPMGGGNPTRFYGPDGEVALADIPEPAATYARRYAELDAEWAAAEMGELSAEGFIVLPGADILTSGEVTVTIRALELSVEPGEPADLLEAAKAVVAEYAKLRHPDFDTPMSTVMKGAFGEAMDALAAAVAHVSEFAD